MSTARIRAKTHHVTVCVLPTVQTVLATGLVIGGSTTILVTREGAAYATAESHKSHDVVRMENILLSCASGLFESLNYLMVMGLFEGELAWRARKAGILLWPKEWRKDSS